MFNITGKYVSVFDTEDKGKYVQANLSTSKKLKDQGTYKNMYWKGRFVGRALESAKELQNGTKIEVTNGVIENEYDKEQGKLWVTVIIFEFNKMEREVN